jgi:hypothetical protein
LAGNVAFYTWPSLGCLSAIGWHEELVAVVGRPTTAVLRGKGRFAFVGMFSQVFNVPIFMKLSVIQQLYMEIFCIEFHQNQ